MAGLFKIGDMMKCRKCGKEIPEGSLFCNMCGTRQEPARRSGHRRGNGQGSIYRRGKVWQVEAVLSWENGMRKRATKSGFKTKNDAANYLNDLINGRIEIKKESRNLKYYYESWSKADMPKLSKSKQTAYRIAWRKLEAVQAIDITKLSIVMLRDLVGEEAPTFYPARDMKSLLSHLFKLAIADQQVTVNMANYITLPDLNETEQKPWTDDELKAIWEAYEQEDVVAAYLLLMIYTGMMPGELCQCRRSMIHLEERQIIGAGLKTDVRKQTPIVIAEFVVPVIERILTYTDDDPERRILYTDRWGFYDAYHEFTKRINIRDLPMYSCRHTTATALAMGTDVAPSIIQKIMRHAKFTTTQRYIHADTSDALGAINKLAPKAR